MQGSVLLAAVIAVRIHYKYFCILTSAKSGEDEEEKKHVLPSTNCKQEAIHMLFWNQTQVMFLFRCRVGGKKILSI